MFGLTFDGAYKLHVHGWVCDDLMLQIVAYTGWVCDELMLKTMIVKCNWWEIFEFFVIDHVVCEWAYSYGLTLLL